MGIAQTLNWLQSQMYAPHGVCLTWSAPLMWAYVVADLFIALAYFSIPFAIFYFLKRRSDIRFNGVFIMFGLFILSCGVTHVMDVWKLWYPNYWADVGLRSFTATISLGTAFMLWVLMPKALVLPSPLQLQRKNDQLMSEVKQREEAEARFESAFEFAPIGMCLVGLEGNILTSNKVLSDFSGYDERALAQLTFNDLVHPDDLEQLSKSFAALAGGQFLTLQLEQRYLHRTGEVRWGLLSASLVQDKDGAALHMIVNIVDRTAKRQAQQQLYESETRLRTIVNTMTEGLVVQDKTSAILESNLQAEAILGLSREQLEGRTSLDPSWRSVREDGSDFAGEEHYAMIALNTGEPQHNGIMGVHKPDGSLSWILVNSSPLRSETNEVTAVVSTFTDITDMRLTMQQLSAYARQLERSNRDLQDFAHVASHDLQEPLRMVSSYVQLLARRYKGKLDADADEFITYAVDGAMRMQKLINDLLSYSRVSTRGDAFDDVSVEAALDDAQANLQLLSEEAAATVTHDDLPDVKGDPAQLSQLLQNLIANAIKFRSEAKPHVHVGVKAEPEDGYWHFFVRDNGIGMPEDTLERIFTLFQRLHTRDKYEGTGIGLAVCRRIVERHGGSIWASSRPGEGSTFHFTLPR